MPLASGTRLGLYEILAPLGAGGMGEVYRAKDQRLGREIAIKVLPDGVATDSELLARFEREARTVAGLNHPNIVTLFSVEDQEGVRFLTMELVEGQTLSTLVAPGGLPLARLLELAIPLTDALVAAHEKGVIHRDLKPGNVMVTREGRVKVLDFGLAKMMASHMPDTDGASLAVTADRSISGDGHVVGTVPYMAPEQLLGEAVDARADLFSLGILLYELATGRRPFTGNSSIEVSSSILRDTPQPLRRVRLDLPADLERIVSRCLEKSARERIQSALDVNNELRRLRKGLERGEPGTPASDQVASIAVLPFANRSANADDEYFSDGLADELLNVLSRIKGLRVTARTSSFHFKGKDTTIAEIGRALNVATLLEGSVRKAGNRIRVSVQLVQVSDSSHLWSETYDRTLEDVFAVQDDIAQSVVKELRTTLLGAEADSDASGAAKAEVAQAVKGRGTDPEAYRLLLLARHIAGRVTREDVEKAIGHLQEALALEPGFALAWLALSQEYGKQVDRGWVTATEGLPRSREALKRALALEPNLPEGHARLAWIQMGYDWDWRGAEASCARAQELGPDDPMVLRVCGVLALRFCRFEEAVRHFRKAVALSPLTHSVHRNLAATLSWAGHFADADASFRDALDLSPNASGGNAYHALNSIAWGRGEEALAQAQREPDATYRLYAYGIIYVILKRKPESDAALQELIRDHGEVAAYQIGEIFAARGEPDEAFEWLERAYAQRDGGLSELLHSPWLRPLHDDPRWEALLKKIGLWELR